MDINKDTFIKNIETLLSQKTKVSGNVNLYVSNDLNKVLVNAEDEAKRMGDAYVSVEHLMLAMIAAPNKAIKQLLKLMELQGISFYQFLQLLEVISQLIPIIRKLRMIHLINTDRIWLKRQRKENLTL